MGARTPGAEYGLFLMPVNIIAYSQLRPDQNNKASFGTRPEHRLKRNEAVEMRSDFAATGCASKRRKMWHASIFILLVKRNSAIVCTCFR
jgi:hypothetical protein